MKESDIIYWKDEKGVIHLYDYEKETGTVRSRDEGISRDSERDAVEDPLSQVPQHYYQERESGQEESNASSDAGRKKNNDTSIISNTSLDSIKEPISIEAWLSGTPRIKLDKK